MMQNQEDYREYYSRETRKHRKGMSTEEEEPRRRYQAWETPQENMPRVRRVNYLVIFFSFSLVVMIAIVLFMLYSLASTLPA